MNKHGRAQGHEGAQLHHKHTFSDSSTSTSVCASELSSTESEEDKEDADLSNSCGEMFGLTRRVMLPSWDTMKVKEYAKERIGRCVLVVDGWVVDVTEYLGEHVRVLLIFISYRPQCYSTARRRASPAKVLNPAQYNAEIRGALRLGMVNLRRDVGV